MKVNNGKKFQCGPGCTSWIQIYMYWGTKIEQRCGSSNQCANIWMTTGVGSMGAPGAGAPMKFLSGIDTELYILRSEVFFFFVFFFYIID